MSHAARARLASNAEILPLRTRQRQEYNAQIVHDSIHRREGWTRSFLLDLGDTPVGFASIAIAGPWSGKPTAFEFYVLPEHRARAFDLFESFLQASGAQHFEIQTDDPLATVMLHAYGANYESEKIVFRDQITTHLPSHGARFVAVTPNDELLANIERRQGGGEWRLELDGSVAATGGLLFHYNRPFGDVYMEVVEPFRRRGLGSYLVQELKRTAYELGAIPAARCNTSNLASRRTLMKAGFVPHSHILLAQVATPFLPPKQPGPASPAP